jgi:hypothetical protein
MIFLFLISSVLFSKEIVVHEINKIENITLSNGSSIAQGGLTIIGDVSINKNSSREKNASISQGVIFIDDENITDVHYDILNIINEYLISED